MGFCDLYIDICYSHTIGSPPFPTRAHRLPLSLSLRVTPRTLVHSLPARPRVACAMHLVTYTSRSSLSTPKVLTVSVSVAPRALCFPYHRSSPIRMLADSELRQPLSALHFHQDQCLSRLSRGCCLDDRGAQTTILLTVLSSRLPVPPYFQPVSPGTLHTEQRRMSEDDRAAKAARARALLKKRQAQKAAEHGGAPSPSRVASPAPRVASPAPSPSRTSTPAPSEPPAATPSAAEEKHAGGNLTELFTSGPAANGTDASWLSGLTRVESNTSPPAASPPPPHPVHVPISPPAPEREDLRILVRDQRRAIESLEAEKASLVAQVEALSQAESKSRYTQELLHAERAKAEGLEGTVQELQTQSEQLSREVKQQADSISALQSQKAALAASVEELKTGLTKLNEAEQALVTERHNSTRLQEQVQALDQSIHEYTERIEQQQQTISLLVSEKASLTSVVEDLEYTKSALSEAEGQLNDSRTQNGQLQGLVSQLQVDAQAAQSRIESLSAAEKTLTDKSRDQEQQIQFLNGRVEELKKQSDEYLERVEELEERIKNDDRVERLEETLKNTQDRADDLEFQLSKLRQTHTQIQEERDQIAAQLQQKAQAETDWEERYAEVERLRVAAQEQLSAAVSEKDNLIEERTALQTEMEDGKSLVSELQQKLAALSSELSLNARQLKQVQAELRAAIARAEDAEKTQKELQAEGIGLMRSLDEMRPKIVELTDAKLVLSEKVDSLEKTVQNRDTVIAQLEAKAEELREEKDSSERDRDDLKKALAAERATQEKDSSEIQQAYSEMQVELAAARRDVQDLEDERNKLRQVSNSNVEEIRRLTDTLQSQSVQLSSLRSDLNERTEAQAEAAEFLSRAQAEMETLRTDLAQKDEELERLREALSAPPSRAGTQSLDEEMLNALKQQHALELSEAQSQVRAAENTLHKTETQVHTLQRQITVLEDELAQLRAQPRPSSRSSTHAHHTIPRRTSSRTVDVSDDLRRASFSSHRPTSTLAPPQTTSAFEGLSPETRHKRKVSLSMLKVRIDSELAASSTASRPSSRNSRSLSSPVHRSTGLPAVIEPPSQPATPPPQAPKRPVFMDESHIFWCHSCQGDLVVL
ncbi:hypothetical protein C8Q78DRAFT_1017957 [Trametes maxima]|nr:hypothetical protein C8Q78DRAFT_1017957 [Trametes maxima]